MPQFARTARILTLVCAPVLLLALLPQQSAPAQAAPEHHVFAGTVHAVHEKTGSLDLITGVGFALRLVHIEILPATEMTSGAATIGINDLAPGDVVRADCTMTPSGPEADHIEKMPQPEGP